MKTDREALEAAEEVLGRMPNYPVFERGKRYLLKDITAQAREELETDKKWLADRIVFLLEAHGLFYEHDGKYLRTREDWLNACEEVKKLKED